MRIVPISFKGVTKIVGQRPQACADRVVNIVCHPDEARNDVEKELASRFPSSETQNLANSVSFDAGKTVYLVTGEDYKKIKKLYDDMAKHVADATDIHGMGSQMVSLVKDSELDRFNDLAKMAVLNNEDATLNLSYDDLSNKITKVDVIL